MSLLFIDGFDHYGNKRNPGDLRKWKTSTIESKTMVTASPPVRNGTHSLKIPTRDILASNSFPPADGIIVGFAVYFPVLPTVGNDLVQILKGDLRLVSLRVDPASRKFQIRGKEDKILANAETVIGAGIWYYIEFKVSFNSSSNSVRFRINGVTEIDQSADTSDNGPLWDCVSLHGVVPDGADTVIDDLYLINLDGAAPYNDLLGTIRVETIYPQLGSGNHADFEQYPTGETDHGKQVDEVVPNTTDYNIAPAHLITGGSETTLEDTYNYPNISPLRTNLDPEPPNAPILERIVGVQLNLYSQRDQNSRMFFRTILNSGNEDFVGADSSVEEFWKYFTQMYQSNPKELTPGTPVEWTEAAVNVIMAGLQVFHVPPPPELE